MSELQLAALAAVFVAFALVSRRLDRLGVTMPMVFVTLGAIADLTGVIDFALEIEGVTILGEITLAVILFSDAARINLRSLRRNAGLPARLLLVGLPLSIVAGALLLYATFPGIALAEAALVGAILAPTDAALGSAVVENKSVPVCVRQALNVESGVNDGLALPAVTMFIAFTLHETNTSGFWAKFLIRQIGLGVVIGAVIGVTIGWFINRARRADWLDPAFGKIGTLAIAILAFASADAAGANGFIAAFVAGLTIGTVLGHESIEHLDEYTEETGRLLAAVTFFVFGNLFVVSAFTNLEWRFVLAAVAILTVGRMLPVAIALADRRMAWQTVAFIGWFGPRGLASMLFGLLLFDREIPGATRFFGIITITIVMSVVLHGVTAARGAKRYAEWFASMEDSHEDMLEATHAPEPRPRWNRPVRV